MSQKSILMLLFSRSSGSEKGCKMEFEGRGSLTDHVKTLPDLSPSYPCKARRTCHQCSWDAAGGLSLGPQFRVCTAGKGRKAGSFLGEEAGTRHTGFQPLLTSCGTQMGDCTCLSSGLFSVKRVRWIFRSQKVIW